MKNTTIPLCYNQQNKRLTCIKDINAGVVIGCFPSRVLKPACLLIVTDPSSLVVADQCVRVGGLLSEADGALLGEGLVTHLGLQIDQTHK